MTSLWGVNNNTNYYCNRADVKIKWLISMFSKTYRITLKVFITTIVK